MVCYTMSLVSCCCQDENDNEEMDMDSPNRFSDLGQKQSAMSSSYPADMSRLQTADSNGRLNTGELMHCALYDLYLRYQTH